MKQKWPIREEANAITVWAFRNGFLEELHSGKHSALLEQPGLCRITNTEMKRLMMETAAKMARILTLRDNDPKEYERQIEFFQRYCEKWEK